MFWFRKAILKILQAVFFESRRYRTEDKTRRADGYFTQLYSSSPQLRFQGKPRDLINYLVWKIHRSASRATPSLIYFDSYCSLASKNLSASFLGSLTEAQLAEECNATIQQNIHSSQGNELAVPANCWPNSTEGGECGYCGLTISANWTIICSFFFLLLDSGSYTLRLQNAHPSWWLRILRRNSLSEKMNHKTRNWNGVETGPGVYREQDNENMFVRCHLLNYACVIFSVSNRVYYFTFPCHLGRSYSPVLAPALRCVKRKLKYVLMIVLNTVMVGLALKKIQHFLLDRVTKFTHFFLEQGRRLVE